MFALSQKIIERAKELNVTIAAAESCTGGLLGGALTEVAGASEVFYGSAVTYHNSAKQNLLGVSYSVLKEYGAVSPQCAIQMAQGAAKIYDTLLAVSVTGIAGPDGGSEEKPVGTVWFGCSSPFGNYAYMRKFSGDRAMIRQATVKEALQILLKELK